MTLQLSLVIPAYNEADRLAAGLDRLHDAVAKGAIDPITTEFVLVDDGSADDTAGRAKELLALYPHVQIVRLPENLGKGAAVRAGVAAATGRLIAFADADMAIDPGQTPEFVSALATHHVAIGSRAATGASVDRPSLRRSLMNRSFNRLVNLMTRVSLADTQCGFKAFHAPAAKLLFHLSTTERFAFDVEVLSLARRLQLSIAEVPVHWLRVGGSRIRPWTDTVSMVRDVFRAGRRVGSAVTVPCWDFDLGDPDDLSRRLPPGLPLLRRPDGRMVAACPFADEAGIEEIGAAVTLFSAVPRRGAMTVAQLGRCTPLWLASGAEIPSSS
ncbi:MAG TPA: glycosyltransferase [Acidimicrobiales bacterium]|nr:glycosyltransferase [Acidimicrobiales bacterium]